MKHQLLSLYAAIFLSSALLFFGIPLRAQSLHHLIGPGGQDIAGTHSSNSVDSSEGDQSTKNDNHSEEDQNTGATDGQDQGSSSDDQENQDDNITISLPDDALRNPPLVKVGLPNGTQLNFMQHWVTVGNWCQFLNALPYNKEEFYAGPVSKLSTSNQHLMKEYIGPDKVRTPLIDTIFFTSNGSTYTIYLPHHVDKHAIKDSNGNIISVNTITTYRGEMEVKDIPIVGISLFDALFYCNWINHNAPVGKDVQTDPELVGPYFYDQDSDLVTVENQNNTLPWRLPHVDELQIFLERNNNLGMPALQEWSDSKRPGAYTGYETVAVGGSSSSGGNNLIKNNKPSLPQPNSGRSTPAYERNLQTTFRLVKTTD